MIYEGNLILVFEEQKFLRLFKKINRISKDLGIYLKKSHFENTKNTKICSFFRF